MTQPSDGAALRRVTLRAPVRDPLLARQRLERALASLDWSLPGLPRRALLLVRRLVATGQRTPALGRSIAESLRVQAREARRPWIDGAAGSSGAVWFADDDELAACLLREWLRGRAQESWWSRAALGDEPLSCWLARRVTNRGDRLVAVIAQLASIGLAAPWIARLDEATAHAAVRAIARDHAAPAIAQALDEGLEDTIPRIRSPRMHEDVAAATLSRIAAAAPELDRAPLAPARARLLVVALVAARDPALLRSAGFAQVLHAQRLGAPVRSSTAGDEPRPRRAAAIEDESSGIDRRGAGPPHDDLPSDANDTEADRVDATLPLASTPRPPLTRDTPARAPAGTFDDTAAPASTSHDHATPIPQRALAHDTTAGPNASVHLHAATAQPGRGANDAVGNAPSRSPHRAEAAVANVLAPAIAALPDIRAIATSFGGLFYLLNAALGLGLYGDFTRPDQPGIALSPWRLLAMAGDDWFGDEFAQDALAPWLARMGGAAQRTARPRAWAVADAALQPWGPVAEVRYRATARRLRVCHPAGFALFDVPRSSATPAAQVAALCRDRELLASARPRVDRQPPKLSGDRWRDWLLPLLRARLARALGVADDPALLDEVCRARAHVSSRPAWVDVTLSLAALSVAIRVAGLDRDPGWIPAAGRDVRFHFE